MIKTENNLHYTDTALTLSDSKSDRCCDCVWIHSRCAIHTIRVNEDAICFRKKWLHLVRWKANGFEIDWTIHCSLISLFAPLHFEQIFLFLSVFLSLLAHILFVSLIQSSFQHYKICHKMCMPRTNFMNEIGIKMTLNEQLNVWQSSAERKKQFS